MMAPVVQAVEALKAAGNDNDTVASLLLNGAAALVLERYTADEFAALARHLWETSARQVQLLDLLDRVTQKREFRVTPKRRATRRSLRQGETS